MNTSNINLYSVKDTAKIFNLQESRLRYWTQTGFVGPSVRRGGRYYYTFQDLIGVKAAVELLDRGIPLQRVRKHLDALRAELPEDEQPLSKLRVCSDGDSIVVVDGDSAYQPDNGQLVMTFAVSSLSNHVTQVLHLHSQPAAPEPAATPSVVEAGDDKSAYQLFLAGCRAEAQGDDVRAETVYRRSLELDPALAAARTNLGNLLYRKRELRAAREAYEHALELDPEQPEARFNLGNVLDDLGETDLAIAELRHVCSRCPEFADAHFNLGVILARVGGITQARTHLTRYLELDPDSDWATRARTFLTTL